MTKCRHFTGRRLREGHVDVAKLLLQNGADVTAVNKWKSTALHLAAEYGHIRCILQLLCFGVAIDEKVLELDRESIGFDG